MVTAGLAAALGVAYLLLPRPGSDLSAQVARADFFAEHGWAVVDLRWYAGVNQLGYSLVSQPVMALLGVRVTGVLALLVSAVTFAALLRRTRVARPLPGALVGAVCLAGNLLSGRVTYALGVALGLAALLALTYPRLRPAVVVAALLASATSPVAGLFLGLAGVALLAARRWGDGLLVAVPAAVPLAVSAGLFGDGGWMNISQADAVRAVGMSLLVAVLVPHRPVRYGALLSAAGVVAATLVHTPVGLNATRLAVMFGLPLLAACARPPGWPPARLSRILPARPPVRPPARLSPILPAGPRGRPPAQPDSAPPAQPSEHPSRPGVGRPARLWAGIAVRWRPWALVAVLVAVCWWQPPVVVADLRDIGNPTADPGFFAPLRDRLAGGSLTGRVEIPPTRDYWEAAYMGDVPLARGWLRQADIDRNPLFFTSVPGAAGTGVPLTAESYRDWLSREAVQYVAVPKAPLSWVGRAEAQLIGGGLPYLTPVWSDARWQLYAVTDPTPIVAAPGRQVSHTASTVTFDAPAAGDVRVRVRYSPWLRVDGGATVAADGEWTVVRVPAAGRYNLRS
ncbi:hypothetical protein EV385_4701 [Krasilnikovia cinnamomea]|uniref:Uncharacterized protein n=1 Tax=Krasilnikovia cinnamomea TaxID=349313 RepID=A0A4Q7ZP31_9ACTN|nr:hypothetical protein EV385_4701 [Krasilnikovia cinnamomea]